MLQNDIFCLIHDENGHTHEIIKYMYTNECKYYLEWKKEKYINVFLGQYVPPMRQNVW
jgi:hypothetical protein